jgi:hypothetical protein
MASIENARLTVSTDQNEQVYVSVNCDVQFTDFEVSAMNELGLQYRLQCQLINKDLWDVEIVAVLDDQVFPRDTDLKASKTRHVDLETVRSISDLHTHVFTKDKLRAELTLRNEETGEAVVTSTEAVAIDLASL